MPRTGNDSLDVQELYESLMWVLPAINPNLGQVEPPARYKRDGLIAWADGVNWNPNSQGKGYYRYDLATTAWVKLLEPDDTFTTLVDADKVDTFHASQTPTASYLLAAAPDGTMPIKPIWDKLITGAAVTSVTTDGEVTLDGNAHGGYFFEFVIYNSTGSTINPRLYYNNDTTNTNYEYGEETSAWANDAIFGYSAGLPTNSEVVVTGAIVISPSGYIATKWFWSALRTLLHNIQGTQHKKASVANLTRIDIVSSVAIGIGINSQFRLWRRK